MTELRTHYGPTAEDPDPGKEWHYGCGGEVLTFKDGIPICSKCNMTKREERVMENPTYEICEHHVMLHEECYLCKGETPPTAVDKCNGTHPVQGLKYVGTLELLICLDRQCAHITAKCTHQTAIPESEDTVPRKYTTSACEWNADGTVLTCMFCGVDGT